MSETNIINQIKEAFKNQELISRKTKDGRYLMVINVKTREFFLTDLEKVPTLNVSYEELQKGSQRWENMNEDGSAGNCALKDKKL